MFSFVSNLLVLLAMVATASGADTPGKEKSLIGGYVNFQFNCTATAENVCNPESDKVETLKCKLDSNRVTAIGFHELSELIGNRSKHILTEIEETPHLLPKYDRENIGSLNLINESISIEMPSNIGKDDLTDSVTAVCEGTWGVTSITVDGIETECDDGKTTCSQVHAVFNSIMLGDIAKYLEEAAKSSKNIVLKNSALIERKIGNRMFFTDSEEPLNFEDALDKAIANSGSKIAIIKTLDSSEPLAVNSTFSELTLQSVAPDVYIQ